MAGRFLSTRDNDFFHKVNKELLGDSFRSKEGIINQEVTIYQLDAKETSTNMYGEASTGKSWKDGVTLKCLIDAEDFDFNTDEFGPDTRQDAQFHFQRDMLIDVNFRPDIGDIVSWNLGYFEITKTNENQLVAGDYNKNWTISCTGTLTRINSLNIEQTRAF